MLGMFPTTRLRRNRLSSWSRDLIAENKLSSTDLILPIFVTEGTKKLTPVNSMPGVNRHTIDLLGNLIDEATNHGIRAFAIFPEIENKLKTSDASEALNPENLVCRAIRKIKSSHPEVGIICDAALDPFNLDGHDGIEVNGEILNDETIDILCKQSIIQAEAGCHVIAPSDMMDGRVGAIRKALDKEGFQNVLIMSYAAKYASAFYGPFRDAIGSKGALKGNKNTYQMDPANSDEAIREVGLDIDEGADMVIVKPGLPYLDIIARVKKQFAIPTIAYQVSGEYSMIKSAVNNGWLENDKVILESLIAFKRAGADAIVTYLAIEAAKLLDDNH